MNQRGRKSQKDEETCILRSLIVYTLHQYYYRGRVDRMAQLLGTQSEAIGRILNYCNIVDLSAGHRCAYDKSRLGSSESGARIQTDSSQT
jgi:hypothetical protein